MTKLAVLHLSDIHIHDDRDEALKWGRKIAESIYHDVREADACLIAITGDIAYSGSVEQYQQAATRLFSPVIDAIKQEAAGPVYFSAVPGNHDCVLMPPNKVREIVIESVIEDPQSAKDSHIIETCTKVQSNYFNFAKNFNQPEVNDISKLFWQQEIELNGNKIVISGLNAAWMSRLSEGQGQMVYPIREFDRHLQVDASLHLALVHHPLNWYSQAAYQDMRKRLRLSCTAVLSGHEHEGNVGKIEETLSGSSLFFEAAALQPHEANVEPGFSMHMFDISEKQISSQAFQISRGVVQKIGEPYEAIWSTENLLHGALDINSDFSEKINDAGGNFSHTAKERLAIDDVFVWPDLRELENKEAGKQRIQSSRELQKKLINGDKFIVYGDDKSGKSTLLYRIFHELISKGYAPLYISCSEINVRSEDDARKRILESTKTQYKHPDAINTLPREKRILLVDDLDRLKSGASHISRLLDYGERHFGGLCLTAASGFEVTNLTSKEALTALSPYQSYDLLRFGLKLRHQLIQKWCSLSGVATKQELDKRVDEVESVVNAVIGRQLVPEHPIYLLILLQSSEQHRHGEIQNSGLSFYYQYLITKSLGQIGVKPSELDEHFNYLSMLAWRFQRTDSKELELIDLRVVNDEFTKKYVTVDLQQRLSLLERARLISRRGDSYSFSYPYVHYFFVGRYLSKNLENPEIRDWVEESCKKLYLRDRAHAIMFLTHHAENRWVIGLICGVLRSCFSGKNPIELNGDIEFLNGLVQRSTQLTAPEPDVETNQVEIRALEDEYNDREQNLEEIPEDYNDLSFTSKWNLLHKTAEILGLILKNYYGSLEREQKQEMIKEVFDAPLRALRLWLEAVSAELNDLVNELKSNEQRKELAKRYSDEDAYVRARIFNFVGMVTTSVVMSAGGFISSEKLREDISTVVGLSQTNAYRLIEIASRLLRPGHPPLKMVKTLSESLDKNPYAFGVLQSLGYMHMYMFHTDESTKQALCKALKISLTATKAIEANKRARILN